MLALSLLCSIPALCAELDALSKNNDPVAHKNAGMMVVYTSKKVCDKKGGILIKDKDGKKFCSYFPGM